MDTASSGLRKCRDPSIVGLETGPFRRYFSQSAKAEDLKSTAVRQNGPSSA